MTRVVNFGEIFELERHPVEVDVGETYTQIGIRSFGNGIFHRPSVTGDGLSKLKYFHVYPNRIIFSNIMAWEGAVALSGLNEEGTIGSQRFLSYKPTTDEVDLRYVNYFFQSDHGAALIRDGSTGSVKRNQTLSPKTIEWFEIPLPDLAEQRRIADRLDSSFARLDAAHPKIDRATKLRDGMLGSFFFSHRWPTEPAGRVLVSVREPINIYQNRKYRATGIKSFGRGLIRYPPQRGSELSKLRYFIFPANALAISNIKAWEGAVAVTADDAADYVASNRFLFYVPSDRRVDVRFVRYYLLSREGLHQLNQASPGSADRNRTLSVKSFEQVKVPVPDLDVQRKVADALDSVTIRVDPLEQRRTELLKAIKPSLLNAAFSGQL